MPGRLFQSKDNWLDSAGNHSHLTKDRYKLLLVPLWHFFVCRGVSIAEQPQMMEEVKENSCHIFDLLSKLSEKTEQLIGNQAQ